MSILELFNNFERGKSIFTNTDIDGVEARYSVPDGQDTFTLAIEGTVVPSWECFHSTICSVVKRAGATNDTLIIATTDMIGVPALARRFAKRYNIRCDLISTKDVEIWRTKYATDDDYRGFELVNIADALVFFGTPKERNSNFIYQTAKNTGRYVMYYCMGK